MTIPSTNGSASTEAGPRSRAPYFFEVAWEVCNQVGGIYTVIKSKTPSMLERWRENYLLIGPYRADAAAIEFEESDPPAELREVLARLSEQGISCFFGRWLINGRPHVLLIDYRSRFNRLADDKYLLWKDHGISSPQGDYDIDSCIAFGFCVTEFFKLLAECLPDVPLIAHFHEWLAGAAVPRLRHDKVPVATVFTTHATLLGRYIASDNPNFYRDLDWIKPDEAAAHYNIWTRFAIERAAAHAAHVFTTISEVTAREAEKILGRRADFILPNGINIQRFTAMHEFQNLHRTYKEQIHEFVMGHFFPSYSFDLDHTLYLFTSGRYEYSNKGMDIFIEALYRLNQQLRSLPNAPTVVAFIVTQGAVRNINVTALQNHLMFNELKNICGEFQSGAADRALSAVVRHRLPSYEDFMPNDLQVRLKRVMHAMRSPRLPGIVTHDMVDDGNDVVLRHLRHRGLFNSPADPVKVIFHPEFITATSPLFGLDYDQFVRGCHLGVFPSYYEPWGYTPLECMALGLPAITTDLSGFGSYAQRNIPGAREQGVVVLNRAQRSPDQTIDDLATYLMYFAQLTRRERIELRNRAERLADIFDWSLLALHYHRAHDEALARAYPALVVAAPPALPADGASRATQRPAAAVL